MAPSPSCANAADEGPTTANKVVQATSRGRTLMRSASVKRVVRTALNSAIIPSRVKSTSGSSVSNCRINSSQAMVAPTSECDALPAPSAAAMTSHSPEEPNVRKRKASWHGTFRARCDVPVTLSPRVAQTIPASQIGPAGWRGQFHLILLSGIRLRHAPLRL